MIGDVEITIVDIRGDKCRVGIEAPKDVPVHRREVYDAIKRSQAEKPNPDCEDCLYAGKLCDHCKDMGGTNEQNEN